MLDLTILMPCLNEAGAVGLCVRDALRFLAGGGLAGEVLVVDNGSDDGSAAEAARAGARVIHEARPGYGRALRTGLAESRGRVILMGDSDTTYDFLRMEGLWRPLAEGSCDLMIGDRLHGGMEKGAMSLSHRIGVRALSALARHRFHCEVRDFHCGLRGITRAAAEKLDFQCDGMEFATEMIARAAKAGMRIGQAPVPLRRSRVKRQPKIRTFRDGWRHLRYILRGW